MGACLRVNKGGVTRIRAATIRFYIDQDVRGLGILLGSIRPDVTYPGDLGGVVQKRERPPCRLHEGALDEEWLPVVGDTGWLVISRDKAIQESLSELTAVREHNVKMVCLTGESSTNKWSQLEATMTYWHRIEELADEPGPFVYKMSRPSGLRPVDVDGALDRLRNGRRRNRP